MAKQLETAPRERHVFLLVLFCTFKPRGKKWGGGEEEEAMEWKQWEKQKF
jgi:hypothetical protein